MSPTSNDRVLQEHIRQNFISTVAIAVGVAVAIAGGFWTVVNPRSELDDIKKTYLTVNEHRAFEGKVAADIKRIDEEAVRDDALSLHKSEFDAWRNERGKTVDGIQAQINHMDKMINDTIKIHQDFVSRNEMNGVIMGIQRQIDELQREIRVRARP